MSSQDARMRTVLLGLELLSHGATQAWNPSGSPSGEPDDRTVTFVLRHEEPPHLAWQRIYNRQRHDTGRETVIDDAAKELNTWTRRSAAQIEGKPITQWIIDDGEGWEPAIVAQRFGVDEAFVRRTRMRADRGTEDGKPVQQTSGPVDRPTKARKLRAGGMSTRQIAVILDTHQTQVMRWIRQT